jgi:hypothetical protein
MFRTRVVLLRVLRRIGHVLQILQPLVHRTFQIFAQLLPIDELLVALDDRISALRCGIQWWTHWLAILMQSRFIIAAMDRPEK